MKEEGEEEGESCMYIIIMRWMPRRQEAMKDVVACEKPRGVGKQTLIRGCPNGETRPFWVIRV